MSTVVSVIFTVTAMTKRGETLCLSGSDPRLGSWNPSNSIPLLESERAENHWTCTVSLEANTVYRYRYFVSRRLPAKGSAGCEDDSDNTALDIVRWETHQQPRQFQSGQEKSLTLPVVTFGNNDDGVSSESVGWLMGNVFEVHVRLHGNPIKLQRAGDSKGESTVKHMVRCVPVNHDNLCQSSQDSSPLTYEDVLVSNLSCKDSSRPRPQDSQGVGVDQGDFVVFRHRTSCLSSLGFTLEISECVSDDGKAVGVHVGSAHLVPENLPESQQVLSLPIICSDVKCCGSLKVDVLVARPTSGMTFDMESCDQSYWHWRNQDGKSLDGGHRGMGASFSVANPFKENTVASFDAAYKFGADFIETDILVTKDLVPVIYHDFNATTAMTNKPGCETSYQLHTTPIHDLTMEQVRLKKFFTHSGKEINDGGPSVEKKNSPFPTLEEILTDVKMGLGFDLEFKYPQKEETGEMEAEAKLDMNTYVDTILKVIYQHAKDRRIFFSTFNPEICILLKLKQSRYPVAFLSQGESKMYTNFLDYRSATFPNAISFAISEGILGLVLHTELLLDDRALVEEVRTRHLALFVWGLDNNDPAVICRMRKHQVEGVIYDRVDLYKPENAHQTNDNEDGSGGVGADDNHSNNSNNGGSPHGRRHNSSGGGNGEGSPKKRQKY